jgi:GDP-D-mannose dehydratase
MAAPRHHFLQADIADGHAMETAFRDFDPDIVLHLAAESHVDRSIDVPRRSSQLTCTAPSSFCPFWRWRCAIGRNFAAPRRPT